MMRKRAVDNNALPPLALLGPSPEDDSQSTTRPRPIWVCSNGISGFVHLSGHNLVATSLRQRLRRRRVQLTYSYATTTGGNFQLGDVAPSPLVSSEPNRGSASRRYDLGAVDYQTTSAYRRGGQSRRHQIRSRGSMAVPLQAICM